MSPTVRIREATEADAHSICHLIQEHAAICGETAPIAPSYLAKYLAHAGNGILVAEREGRIAGLLSYSIRPDLLHAGNSCLIEELIVSADARDHGIGGALLDELACRIRESRCVELSVAVMADNADGVRFYRAHGLKDEALLLERHFDVDQAG